MDLSLVWEILELGTKLLSRIVCTRIHQKVCRHVLPYVNVESCEKVLPEYSIFCFFSFFKRLIRQSWSHQEFLWHAKKDEKEEGEGGPVYLCISSRILLLRLTTRSERRSRTTSKDFAKPCGL